MTRAPSVQLRWGVVLVLVLVVNILLNEDLDQMSGMMGGMLLIMPMLVM